MKKEKFGELIAKYRKKNNLTQGDLAKILNVSDKAVSNWENGKNYPDIEIIAQLSNLFHYDFYHNILRQEKKKTWVSIIFICLFLLFLSLFFFLLFYFITDNKDNQFYYVMCEDINLTDSYLIKYEDKVVLNLGEIDILDSEILNITLFIQDKEERDTVLFRRYQGNLVVIDEDDTYFNDYFFEHLNELYIAVAYQKDNTSYTDTFKLELRKDNSFSENISKDNQITLLFNNGYDTSDNLYFVKENDSVHYYYDLSLNKFYMDQYNNQISFHVVYDVEESLVTIESFYEEDSPIKILDFYYDVKTKKQECVFGDCKYGEEMLNQALEEYSKIA